ncbi:hypothetical protein DL765_011210 [Monosporascus sp. GIB2]|nr:hypothetical protein DL765_011210 [Monosporascus sp. GIB2]
MATARKRLRPENDETQAGCPFTVTYPDSNETKKKARRRRQESEREMPRPMIQRSPFRLWANLNILTAPSSVFKGIKYHNGNFIFVANSSTIRRQKHPHEAFQLRKKPDYDWVAMTLEIRASDENHVYAKHSIDVDPKEQQATIKLTVVENGEAVETKQSMTGAVAFGTGSKKGGRQRKWEPSGPSTARPYEGLFEAAIRSNVSPLVIEIRDLRENVTREEKEWTESIGCLVCGHQIN